MLPLRIAIALRCFQQPLKDSLQSAAKTGATGVQIDARYELKPSELSETGRRHFVHQLEELGLSVASLNFPTRSRFCEPERLEERLQATQAAMQLAYRLNARVLTLRVGPVPDDPDSEESTVLCNVLNELARFGNRTGVTIAITPTRESPEELARLFATVSEGPIGVNLDPATFVTSGHDPIAAIRTLHEFLTHVQVRDAVCDVEGSGLEVPVGRGEVVWDEFLALLDEADYQGWLTVDRTQGSNPANDAARAVRYLQQVALG